MNESEAKIIYYNFSKLLNDGENVKLVKDIIDNAILKNELEKKEKI